ncbi:hypothetical protein L1987_08602 [Smallanthus sonchifolius]|uniref:Uncharacterized protein n=1 Tax=Smallanthus sonchifolius TaxID=185202 RepID=A0ACB9JLL6_9ASTR|nr:hypothetical protein L1987_08602 [Smallanthus sonchifolius]
MADDHHHRHKPLASLPIPPLTSSKFSDDLTFPDDFHLFDDDSFDITFDDLHLPSDTKEFPNSTLHPSNLFDMLSSDLEFNEFVSDLETVGAESGVTVVVADSGGGDRWWWAK